MSAGLLFVTPMAVRRQRRGRMMIASWRWRLRWQRGRSSPDNFGGHERSHWLACRCKRERNRKCSRQALVKLQSQRRRLKALLWRRMCGMPESMPGYEYHAAEAGDCEPTLRDLSADLLRE